MPLYAVEDETPAWDDVVSMVEMRKHLNVDHDIDDEYIEIASMGAVQYFDGRDGVLGRALAAQTWDYALPGFASECPVYRDGANGYSRDVDWRSYDRIELPLPPLIVVQSIKYYDRDNALQTVSDSTYEVVGSRGYSPGYIALKRGQSWPAVYDRAEPVIIRFRAGYYDPLDSPARGEVPAPLIAAIKFLAGHFFQNREVVVIGKSALELPWAIEALIAPYRVLSR